MIGSPRPIADVATSLGIDRSHFVPYGDDKAKVRLEALDAAQASGRKPGRLILVTAITPTSAGEGKTTTSIGLAQGMAHLGERVCLALREPSMGPVFGTKGGATGGGRSTVVPSEDINLHFTGDFHAITAAHNLLASMLDNHLQQGNALGIDPRRILWRRVIDANDRALRNVVVGLGGPLHGVPRETGFDITAASEVMAVLCLSTSIDDLRARLSRLTVGLTREMNPVTAADLGAVGAMMVVLKDALMPNLVQSVEGVPAFVHGGPFANIAHGCNSVLATRMALAHADWVITEAGFASDLGAEKFFDIKCRTAGFDPEAVVVVATVRALKLHGGADKKTLAEPDAAAVERGLPNLAKHVENARTFGKPAVVAINRFHTDSDEELAAIRRYCESEGVEFALSEIFAKGGEGGTDLARAVIAAVAKNTGPFTPLYELDWAIPKKIEAIATKMYGAASVAFSPEANRDLARIEKLGYGNLPICIAKTQNSLSDDPTKLCRPSGFEVRVRNLVLAAGAGFVVALLGDIVRMPGLGASPQALRIDLVDGKPVGLMA